MAQRGDRTIAIKLSADEASEVLRLIDKQRGPTATAPRRALLTGLRFLANAGTPKGKKERR